jgi:hypothetical protein
MNGASPDRAMSRPLTRPISPHTASGSSRATAEPYCEPQAASTPPRAKSEPTDRSIPPVMITNVMPSATTARKAEDSAMFAQVVAGQEGVEAKRRHDHGHQEGDQGPVLLGEGAERSARLGPGSSR